MLGGRVKTLHPAVHGGILAQDTESDAKDLAEQKISKVDYVVCNLYPFKDTVAKVGVSIEEGKHHHRDSVATFTNTTLRSC